MVRIAAGREKSEAPAAVERDGAQAHHAQQEKRIAGEHPRSEPQHSPPFGVPFFVETYGFLRVRATYATVDSSFRVEAHDFLLVRAMRAAVDASDTSLMHVLSQSENHHDRMS